MTDDSMQRCFNRPVLNLSAVTLCLLLVCGCASNTIDQAVPISAQIDPSPNTAVKNAGQYPNINIVPTGETAQLTDGETAATRARLENEVLVQQQRGESPAAYLERLRKLQKLGSTHAAATLRQIENGQ